jgi:aldehyde:ferredoxin oxidoreductase
LPAGISPGAALPSELLDAMIVAYYSERGWDAEGQPIPETIRELDLEEFAAAS